MTADIITLQEVQKDAYDEWFKPELAAAGYDGVFQPKRRDAMFHKGKYTIEGCATFYKVARFRKLEQYLFDFDKQTATSLRSVTSAANRGVSPDFERSLQRASKGNIALALVLEDLTWKTSQNWQLSGPSGGHKLCVVNTHILADVDSTDVKLWQVNLLLHLLEQHALKNMPLLVCGDFNSTPNSAVYEYLCHGTLRPDHEELQSDPCGLLEYLNMSHDLRMSTAYATCNGKEAEHTNYTHEFKGTLDYIFFSSELLDVLAVSQVDDEVQLSQETALPSSTRPSDHVSLVATFMYNSDGPPASFQQSLAEHLQHHAGPNLYAGMYRNGHHARINGVSGDGLFIPGAQIFEPYGVSYGAHPWVT